MREGLFAKAGWLAAGALFAGALAIYAAGALRSPLLDHEEAARRSLVATLSLQDTTDMVRETVLARAYWDRNPDVREHAFFGDDGPLGAFGAREHYDRHGRLEGRRWGP